MQDDFNGKRPGGPGWLRGFCVRDAVLAVAALLVLSAFALGGAPAWWAARGVTDPARAANDFAPVNQGQLKKIATEAINALDAGLPGGAGTVLLALRANLAQRNPAVNDYAPVNLGQIKATATPIYDRLILGGLATGYPWANPANPADDFALANIGQLKALFAFSLPAAPPATQPVPAVQAAAAPPPAPAPPPSISNGDFSNVTQGSWNNAISSTEYKGGGFRWAYVAANGVPAWSALVGTKIEVWKTDAGEQFIELDGSLGNHGVKQQVKDAAPGTFLLTWKHLGRKRAAAGDNGYTVMAYTTKADGSDRKDILTPPKSFPVTTQPADAISQTAWQQQVAAFTVKPEDLQPAPIYVFTPPARTLWIAFDSNDNNTYGSLIDEVRLLPVEMRITDRDDPKKKWADNVVKTAPVYSGKSTGDMVSWKLGGTDSWTNATFTWSAEGPEAKTGPSGPGKNEWKIADGDEDTANDWLGWKPGKYKIKCAISFAGGSNSTVEFDQEVGVRTDDIVVVGWIDQTKVALNPAGVQPALLKVWPVGGIQAGDGDNVKIKAALLAEQISARGVGSKFEIDVDAQTPFFFLSIGVDFNAFSQADKDYALKWMFRYANNPPPRDDFRDEHGFFSQSQLDDFEAEADRTKYKLLNHYQAKFLVMEDGMIKSITPIRGMKARAAIGNTKDPSHFWEIDGPIDRIIKGVGWMLGYPVGGIFEGIPSDKNDENAVEGNYTLKHFNEGTPDQPALDAFKHLTGHDQGYIWSSITFYSDLGYYHDAPFTQGQIKTQVYPSYRIYINGELKSTVDQAASPWALFPNTDRCR